MILLNFLLKIIINGEKLLEEIDLNNKKISEINEKIIFNKAKDQLFDEIKYSKN